LCTQSTKSFQILERLKIRCTNVCKQNKIKIGNPHFTASPNKILNLNKNFLNLWETYDAQLYVIFTTNKLLNEIIYFVTISTLEFKKMAESIKH
jgi:hypothetical protein